MENLKLSHCIFKMFYETHHVEMYTFNNADLKISTQNRTQ